VPGEHVWRRNPPCARCCNKEYLLNSMHCAVRFFLLDLRISCGVYKHNPTDAIQCHYCYKQLEKKRLLPYFDEAQYNKEEFITRDILKLFKFINEKLLRTDNSINNSIMV